VREDNSQLAFLRWRIDTAMCRAVVNGIRSRDAVETTRRLRSDSERARREREGERPHELPHAS
jgi:hypothetical protein